MDIQVLQKGNLTIALDKDFLAQRRTEMLATMKMIAEQDVEDVSITKKNKIPTEQEFEDAVDRLFHLALDIIDNKLGIDIFDYLPYTKAGKFHKTASTLLATSGIKDVWNGDFFQMQFMDLILTPVSYLDKINPFVSLQQNGTIIGAIKGDGDLTYIELCWNARKGKEIPVFDGNNVPTKIEKERKSYLKAEELKAGYTYFDANGNEFLYAGQFYLDNKSWAPNENFQTKEELLQSDVRQKILNHRVEIEQYQKYKGKFMFLKMTKKNEKLIQSCKDVDELLHAIFKENIWDWYSKWKTLENPLKVVSEGRKVIEPDVDDGFYVESTTLTSGKVVEDWFYFEKV